ncbi:hypothetical protein [Archangium violaceum]|uniref:IPT/TIG domain-containing protein n=1 Tax=Archangium violaceum Cb vi76 TaxID=1406225 RepID=A0A084SEW6_9BACT|nr:hypothetical protein [Archangium violaceum]KFA87001.1 hypothetical protein Q664_50795 [Archangium violaceum Cb vi76]
MRHGIPLHLLWALALCLLAPAAARASTVMALDVPALTRGSELVIRGRRFGQVLSACKERVRDTAVLYSLDELTILDACRTPVVSTRSGAGTQHPGFDIRLSGWGEWVMARPARLGASLVLGEDLEGSLWVADHRQELVAEIRKYRGESTRLAVRPGLYRVVRPEGTFAEATDVRVGWSAERVLSRADFIRVPLQRARLRGSGPLVLRPWDVSAGYGLSTGSVRGMGAEHFGEVGLRQRWSRASAHARFGFTRAYMERELFSLSQTELRLSLGGGGCCMRGRWNSRSGPRGRGRG